MTRWLGALGLLVLAPNPVLAAPEVVATILSIHGITAAVMAGVGEPRLLLEGGTSPHAYSLKPSDAAALAGADLIVRVGEGLETFLEAPLEGLADGARVLDLAGAPGVALKGGGDGDHDHAGYDPHLWLSPANGAAMAEAVAAALADVDPANAPTYAANAKGFEARLDDLAAEIQARLDPVREQPYIVFHDAYGYFEDAFGLHRAGTVTPNPEAAPGAAGVADLRAMIERHEAVCVFAEPQFTPRLVATLVEGTSARTGVLDPLGADLEPGPDAYPRLLAELAEGFAACLEPG